MICRNARHHTETMVSMVEASYGPSNHIQHSDAVDGKGVVIEVRFSWWSINGKQYSRVIEFSSRFSDTQIPIFCHSSSRFKESVESSLTIIHDISTENIGTLCISKLYSPLKIPLRTERYDGARQKSDLASVVLQELGFNNHWGKLL